MKRQGGGATAALAKQGIDVNGKSDLPKNSKTENQLSLHDYTDGPMLLGLLFFMILCWLWTRYVLDYSYYRFINEVNIGIHEVGHIVFRVFGNQTIHVLGGTVLQILFPVLFFLFYWKRKKKFVASMCVAWFAMNFFNIAVYMHDATRLQLPLLSMTGESETTIHDRNYLFDLWGILLYTDQIALTMQLLGYFFYLLALTSLGYLLIKSREERVIQSSV